jgi:hypothetical protein
MTYGNKGEIPIPYIIALIIGIIVLTVVLYSFFSSNKDFLFTITEKGCKGKKLSYCAAWKSTSFGAKPNGVVDFSAPCGSITDTNKGSYYAPDCCQLSWAADGLSQEECNI